MVPETLGQEHNKYTGGGAGGARTCRAPGRRRQWESVSPEMQLFPLSLQSPAALSEKRHEDGTGEFHSAWQQHFLLLNSSFDSGKLQLAGSAHPQNRHCKDRVRASTLCCYCRGFRLKTTNNTVSWGKFYLDCTNRALGKNTVAWCWDQFYELSGVRN